MTYRLRDGISYCKIDGGFYFLDLNGNRYFGLRGRTADAFRRLCAAERLSLSDQALLGELVPDVLVPCENAAIVHGIQLARDPSDCIDASQYRCHFLQIAEALTELSFASFVLARRPLIHTLHRLSVQKARVQAVTAPGQIWKLTRIAAAFHRADVIMGKEGLCLRRSLAMVRVLARHQLESHLVFGVRTRPFAAHCWVQCGNVVVNDDVENARAFTPILAV